MPVPVLVPIGETSARGDLQQVLIADRLEPHQHHRHTQYPSTQLAMFSPAVGRVARSANTLAAAPANSFVFTRCARSALSTSTAPQQPFRPSHQRRYSSSKPSTPPNSKKKPAELDQNATAELRGAGRRSKETKKLKEPSTATTGNNVPFVPPTNHLREDGILLRGYTPPCTC